MARIVVTTMSLLAVALAAGLLVWLRAARHSPPVWIEDAPLQQRLAEAVRVTAALLAGSVIAGLLVAGFGGRLLMRLIAVTSDDGAQGRLTEADEVVGQVTAGGTVFFVFFAAAFGVLGGLGFFLFRRWLPSRSIPAGLIVAGIGAGVLARPTDLLNPDSIDFEILGPRWLAALLALALIAGLGALGAVLIDTFLKYWPTPALTLKGLAGLVPLLPLVGFGAGAIVLLPMIATKTAIRPGRLISETSTIAKTLPLLLLAAGTIGWLWTLTSAIQITR